MAKARASADTDDPAATRPLDAGGEMQQRALADAGRSDHGHQFARRDVEREAAQHRVLTTVRTHECLVDAFETQRGHTDALLFHRVSRRSAPWNTPYSIAATTIEKAMVQASTPATFCEMKAEFNS